MTELLNEFSMASLIQKTSSSFDTTKRHNATDEVNVSNLTYTQLANDKIRIDCKTNSSGISYTTQLVVSDVQIVPNGTPNSLDILHTNNIMPIPTTSECQYRCTCLDYRWTFAHYNNLSNNLHGSPPPPYQAKTNRGPRNPSKTPGMCKHILKLIEVLKNAKVVQ